jgi:chemosensory pili system protein ChpA (sensor histidine kinase/response regulator)
MSAVMELDLGPLSWVKGEIDVALARASEALAQYDANPADIGQLKFAQTHLHQAHGALSIVGLDGVTQLSEALEGLLKDVEAGSVAAGAAVNGLAQQCLGSLRGYLDNVVNGEPNQPLRLLPLYDQIQRSRGLSHCMPSDLFFPDLAQRPPRRSSEAKSPNGEADVGTLKAARSRFERGFLQWLRSSDGLAGLPEMREAVAAIERMHAPAAARTFWWITLGFLEVLAVRGVAVDLAVKRICARIDTQMRRFVEGSHTVAERLLRDLLYYIAIAPESSALVQQIKETYQLDALLPRTGAIKAASLQPLLCSLKESLQLAKDHWNRFCAGAAVALPQFDEQSDAFCRRAAEFPQPELARLAKAISETARWLRKDPLQQTETAAMEVATALLLAENALENFERPDNEFPRQVAVVEERLAGLRRGQTLTPLEAPLLGEMSRRAQEKLFMAQVAREILSNLAQIEQTLDGYFRDPSRHAELEQLTSPLKQVDGALTMLGQDRAAELLRECQERVAEFASREETPPQEEFEEVAHKLSGLGFYIDALQHGPADLDAILYPDRPRATAARAELVAETVEQDLEQRRGAAQALAEALKEKPQDESLRRELKDTFESIRQEAALVADTRLEHQAREALAALAATPSAASSALVQQTVAEIAPPPTNAAPVVTPAEDEVDSELLGIFIEEAHEVLASISTHLDASRTEPHNHELLTTIRRGFHTLKGSGRMVGLKELGEAAWSCEQVMNLWLRLEQDATPELHQFIADAHGLLDSWVAQLESGGGSHMDAATLIARADGFKAAGEAPAAPATATEEVAAPAPIKEAAVEVVELEEEPAEAVPVAAPEEQVCIGDLTLSPALHQMFLGEARQHVAVLRRELARMLLNPALRPDEQTQRAAHTLAGISGTVGLAPSHDLARALEHALSRLAQADLAPSAEQAELLNSGATTLEGMVAAVANQVMPPSAAEVIERLAAVAPAPEAPTAATSGAAEPVPLEAVPVPAAPEPEVLSVPALPLTMSSAAEERRKVRLADDIDPQLLPIFLDEAADLMREIGIETAGWRAAPGQAEAARGLARLLHTLKGSARMAGAMGLGELVHSLENRVESAVQAGGATPSFLDELDQSLDRASFLLDQLRGRPPGIAEAPEAVAAAAPTEASQGISAEEGGLLASRTTLRVRADLVDRFVNEAGEISIARSRIDGELRTARSSLLDLTENVIRLRNQLRELEIQAESQMQSRLAQAEVTRAEFDPLEMDRYTRLQELTRLLAESVNDVSTVQHTLLRNLDGAESALNAQGRLTRELQQSLMRVRMVPFASLAERLHRTVRQTAKELDRKANLDIRGGQIELDRSVLEKITGPLEHLLRNAVSHGIEDREHRLARKKAEIGQITLLLTQEGNEIAVEFADDGRGLDLDAIRQRALQAGLMSADAQVDDAQLVDMIFRPGFSTATEVSAIAGRGVGMDVVRNTIQSLGGRVEVDSMPGQGTRFRIFLPQSLVVMQAVLVGLGGRTYAIPSATVEQVMEVKTDALEKIRQSGEVEWLGRKYPFRYLAHLIGDMSALPPLSRYNWIILSKGAGSRVAIQADELRGNHEIVIKKTGAQLARVVGIAGATVLADGEISLIINPTVLFGRELKVSAGAEQTVSTAALVEERRPVVMVVDDSLTVRKITGRLLEREGFQVVTAKDGVDALEQLTDLVPDVMLVDIEMPRMDGFDLTRNVRADARLKAVPIIMITSRLADKHRNYAAEIGVNHYLGKPYQEEELLGLIRSHTGSRAAVA